MLSPHATIPKPVRPGARTLQCLCGGALQGEAHEREASALQLEKACVQQPEHKLINFKKLQNK